MIILKLYIAWLLISVLLVAWGAWLAREAPKRLLARWAVLAYGDYALQPIHYLVAAPVLSIFTRPQPDLNEHGELWGWWFGTRDNPPQGDERWQREAPFPGSLLGVKGYINRVGWLWRNPLYNYPGNVQWHPAINVVVSGNPVISDKYKRPGSYLAIATLHGKEVAFGYYIVKPYKNGKKCFRARIGWKISTDKFKRYGSARLVNTIHPRKTYGD